MRLLTKTDTMLECLNNDGVILFPAALGYGLVASSEIAIKKIYDIKQRPYSKPSGIAVTEKLFKIFCGSHHKNIPEMIPYPIGLVDKFNADNDILRNASSFLKNGDTMAFFLNISDTINELAEACYHQVQVLMITSANEANTGNNFDIDHIPRSIIDQVDHIEVGEADHFFKKRSKFEKITNTILDLTKGELLRAGVYANEIAHKAYELGLLKQTENFVDKNEIPSSILFLLTHKEKSFEQIYYLDTPDWIVLDLQDSCPPSYRDQARQHIQKFMDDSRPIDKPIYILINELDERKDLIKDLALNYSEKITGFWLPMLKSKQDLDQFEVRVSDMEIRCDIPSGHFKFVSIIESCAGLLNVKEIASGSDRNVALVIGHADLLADSGSTRNDLTLGIARQQAVLAAKANKLLALDTPYTVIHDYEGLERDALRARDIGMDTKVALHPKQVGVINKTFSLKQKEYDEIRQEVEFFNQSDGGIFRNEQKKLLAPPFVKKMEKDLKRSIHRTNDQVYNTATINLIQNGVPRLDLFVGRVIDADFPVTIDQGWISQWKSLINNCYRLENDEPFCRSIGYESRPIPYHALINFALCQLVNVYSIHCKYHLGISKVRYLKPAYYHDTLSVSMCITEISDTFNQNHCVVTNRINVLNQEKQIILQLDRRSLFESFEQSFENQPIPTEYLDAPVSHDQIEIEHRIKTLPAAPQNFHLKKIQSRRLLGHNTSNLLDLAVGSVYCNLFRNNHPIHTNRVRYGMDGLAISGGLILPVVCSIVAADLRSVYQEYIIETAHLNPVRNGDMIGAFSYVIKKEKLSDNIVQVTLCTYGTRNIDVPLELSDMDIPLDLFHMKDMKPKQLENLLLMCCPALTKKLAIKVIWKVMLAVQ